MTNIEILEKLASIATNLDRRRIVSIYTSNEGAVSARNALSHLALIKVDKADNLFSNEITQCQKELARAIELNEKFVSRPKGSSGDPSACPIATQHAIERLLLYFDE